MLCCFPRRISLATCNALAKKAADQVVCPNPEIPACAGLKCNEPTDSPPTPEPTCLKCGDAKDAIRELTGGSQSSLSSTMPAEASLTPEPEPSLTPEPEPKLCCPVSGDSLINIAECEM